MIQMASKKQTFRTPFWAILVVWHSKTGLQWTPFKNRTIWLLNNTSGVPIQDSFVVSFQVQMNHYKADTCDAKNVKNCDSVYQEPKMEDRKFAEKFGQILKRKVFSVLEITQL